MPYVVTIDGPAGAGKSSVARGLAKKLGVNYLDTGAIYRAVSLFLNEAGITPDDDQEIIKALSEIRLELKNGQVFVNDKDVTKDIRTARIDELASVYSALACVRSALLDIQRSQINNGSLIVEGRDTGSVVFPGAKFKFFLTATPEARAARRFIERERKGIHANYNEILQAVKMRDKHDIEREISPLSVPEGAVFIDSSDMTEEQVIEKLFSHVNNSLHSEHSEKE